MTDDYSIARQTVRESVREWFTQLRNDRPGENLYAFAFCFHDDFVGQLLASNSVEWLQTKEDPDDQEYAWNPAQWQYNSEFHHAWDSIPKYDEDTHEEVDRTVLEYRAHCLRVTIDALKDLADEGFWKSGDAQVFVFLLMWDNAESMWLTNESARCINPPDLYSTHSLAPGKTDFFKFKDGPVAPRKRGNLAGVFYELFGEPGP